MNNNNEDLMEKIAAMRQLLTEWNPTNDNVWDHPALQKVGETEEDYEDLDGCGPDSFFTDHDDDDED